MGKSIIECFFLEPTDQAEESLRRYCSGSDCPGDWSYHNVDVVIGRTTLADDTNGSGGDRHPHDDPRWPKSCTCGYVFKDEDHWQHNIKRLFRRSDNGGLTTLRGAPVGAMWYADWLPWKGPDGHCLVVKTPAGDWPVDGPASNSKSKVGWQRSGTPPNVTAHPSIGMGQDDKGRWTYHGWLRDGKLVEC